MIAKKRLWVVQVGILNTIINGKQEKCVRSIYLFFPTLLQHLCISLLQLFIFLTLPEVRGYLGERQPLTR